ncbi:MAG: hypothetical protein NZ811_07185 [Gammaproteobacteria bacterium]|nr:hypothetical protein [Gammaproteobacteria bacterium]
MGLLDGTTQKAYYDGSDLGNYQFVTLDDIISSFMVVYVGENKILTKVSRTDVQFHGMRAIQELSYDVLKSMKSQEIEVPPTLKMILPQDYVNYCKIVRVDSNGIEKPIYPTGKTSNPFAIDQDTNGDYNFTADDLTEQAESNTWANYKSQTASTDSDDIDTLLLDAQGRRYGLDPQHAQTNGTFYIDDSRGYIHFGSSLAGETIILKYISDGLGTDDEMLVHKFAEEAVYKWIMYGLISGRTGIPEYITQRFKKEKFAETRKAKIRLSNIKMEEFTQVLRGISKPIK